MISPETLDTILQRLSDGQTLREICRDEGMPGESAIRQLALKDIDGFGKRYSLAREIGYQCMADELLEIADDGRNDWMQRDGRTVPDHDHINRSRLRIDSRKWLLAKCLPKIYGEKLAVTGENGGPLQFQKIERIIVDPIAPPPY